MNTNHFKFCPNCAGEGTVALVNSNDVIDIRGEKFEVPVMSFDCNRCGESFQPLEGDIGLPKARDLYREKHKMVMPAKMIAFRKSLDISQPELATILGWGTATVSRYENGKLQELAYDKELRLVMSNPENLLELVEQTEGLLPTTRARLVALLEPEIERITAEKEFFRRSVAAPGEKVELNKLSKLVVMLCGASGQVKTKLNKLLFYVDFKSYKVRGRTVSGLAYERIQFGPVPANYDKLYSLLAQRKDVALIQEEFGQYEGTRITAMRAVDRNCFEEDELSIILDIKKRFESVSAEKISEISHREQAWKETAMHSIISYEHAVALSV